MWQSRQVHLSANRCLLAWPTGKHDISRRFNCLRATTHRQRRTLPALTSKPRVWQMHKPMPFHDKTPEFVSSLISVPWLPSLSWEEQEQGSAAWSCCVHVLSESEEVTALCVWIQITPLNLCQNVFYILICIWSELTLTSRCIKTADLVHLYCPSTSQYCTFSAGFVEKRINWTICSTYGIRINQNTHFWWLRIGQSEFNSTPLLACRKYTESDDHTVT